MKAQVISITLVCLMTLVMCNEDRFSHAELVYPPGNFEKLSEVKYWVFEYILGS